LTALQFEQLFRPFIRVLLDWEAVKQAEWPIDLRVVESSDELHDWYFPWYTGADGQEASVDAEDARPVAVQAWPTDGSDPHRKQVDVQLRLFRKLTTPVQLLLATYSLPREGHLVLDGNHRLAAAIQGNVPFIALTVTLHGPIDANVLPDLRHWESARS
jgi:hypothetical protein